VKNLTLVIGILLIALHSFSNACLSVYRYSFLTFEKSQIAELPSGRKMQTYFEATSNLKPGDEIVFVLAGLGKASKDVGFFVKESLALGKSVFMVDLHGQGETTKLNPALSSKSEIPFQYNTEDVVAILTQLSQHFKVRIVGHSYGGGIALAAMADLHSKGFILPITKVVLLSPFVKNLDKYYADGMMFGQLPQITADLANPILVQMGVPPAWIKSYDAAVNSVLFSATAGPQQMRDTMIAMNPMFDYWREMMSQGPNFMANMALGPAHMIANADYKDISAWQKNPISLYVNILNNISMINGARDLNFLDYSKKLGLPKHVEFKVVMALNDSVVPNTMNQEFTQRMVRQGYSVIETIFAGENHYYLYNETSMKKHARAIVLD
jgi:pimeloyl-ACP methyl ester carboxylesterase